MNRGCDGMGKLYDRIRQAVEREQVIIGDHADERMLERKIELWQVVSEIGSADPGRGTT